QVKDNEIMDERNLIIPADSFLYSNDYDNFKRFKVLQTKIKEAIKTDTRIANDALLFNEMIALNSEFFETYVYIGDYFSHFRIYDKAFLAYKEALTKEIPNIYQRKNILEKMNDIEN
ncbi:MAG: hypothetical protein ACQESQ_11875, partial [Bacteroidota bacterium]